MHTNYLEHDILFPVRKKPPTKPNCKSRTVKHHMDQSNYIAHKRDFSPNIQSVEEHALGTAELAAHFASGAGLERTAELLGLLHDIGKYSSDFQDYIACGLQEKRGRIDHSTAGAQFVWNSWNEQIKNKSIRRINANFAMAEMMALALAGHHGGLMDTFDEKDEEDALARRMEKADSETHLAEVCAKISPAMHERIMHLITSGEVLRELEHFMRAVMERERAVKDKCPLRIAFDLGCLVKFLFSALVDADRCDTINFCAPGAADADQNMARVDWEKLFCRMESHLAKFSADTEVNKIRRKISDQALAAASRGRGVRTFTAPTGGGKTLASMRYALKLAKDSVSDAHPIRHIIVVLPYTTIIEQNAACIRDILETEESEKNSIVLECHSNLASEHRSWRGNLLSENWDAPIIFTTSVQFLEAIFAGGTRSARRMHQLADSVIIFDEIQTLPIKVVHLFCNAMNFLVGHCGTSLLLCTATQPLLNGVSRDFGALRYGAEDEILADTNEVFSSLKRVDIVNSLKSGNYTIKELGDMAIEKQGEFTSLLVIVNLTSTARELYKYIESKAADSGISVVHLSARMCPAHRKVVLAKINQLLKSNKPLICVSTSVMEAGIDVDFGGGMRALAGFDSIVQASGRCNREGRRGKSSLFIVNPAEEGIGRLEDIEAGRCAAHHVLCEISENKGNGAEILSLANIQQYFKYYFYDRKDDMKYSVETKYHADDTLLNLLSTNSKTLSGAHLPKERVLKQSFATAGELFKVIDAPTKGVIVQYGEGEKIVEELTKCASQEDVDIPAVRKLLRRAQAYSVNVYENLFNSLVKSGGVYELTIFGDVKVYILKWEFYSDEFGVSADQVKNMKLEVV